MSEADESRVGQPIDLSTLEKVLTAIAATSAGVAVGGPAGALLGAGATPAVERIYQGFKAKLLENASRVPTLAAECVGCTPEELSERVTASDQLLMLTATTMHVASQTLWEDKVKALAGMLADGLEDDARVDLSLFLARTVAHL